MICISCRQGADHMAKFGNVAVAKEYHKACQGGTACDCQCDVDAQAKNKMRGAVTERS